MDMNLSKLQEMVRNREAWRATVYGVAELETTRQLNCNNNKFPTYKSSNFKLSKMQMCVHKFSHIS